MFGIPVRGTHAHAFVSSFKSLDDLDDQVNNECILYYVKNNLLVWYIVRYLKLKLNLANTRIILKFSNFSIFLITT